MLIEAHLGVDARPRDMDERKSLFAQIIFRTAAIVAIMAILLMAFVFAAARRADDLAAARQQQLIAAVLDQYIQGVAHDQEASTVWDDAVVQVHAAKPDMAWMDANLGVWFHTYYGHDEVFILDDRGRALYAMRDGRREDIALYDRDVATVARGLIAELRGKMQRPQSVTRDGHVMTPGASDLAQIEDHPAIVSVKPIISESGKVFQQKGHEYLHISVRYLDGAFVSDLARRYGLEHARFTRDAPQDDERSVPMIARSETRLGYIVWTPFKPGAQMFGQLAPALAAAIVLVTLIVAFLLRRIRQSTMQLTAAKARAQHMALHDPLTGLANRALFDQKLDSWLETVRAGGSSIALLYIDLDHFKNVNDSLGHPTGDALISRTAELLIDAARANDLVARLGGDEFAIVCNSHDAHALADKLSADIATALGSPIDLGTGEVLIGASIGIAIAPLDGVDRVELVRKADIALYHAKTTGRRRHCFYAESMGERIRDRREIENRLRSAMRSGEGLDVHYQPIFSTRDGSIVAVEALVRWADSELGEMVPAQFIPVAEECGLVETLGEWVLEQACLAAVRWPLQTLSVNISAVQLRNGSLAERIYAILKRTRLEPSRLELEITETSFLESNDRFRRNLGWLRDIGVRIALDDFGTGYSSFRHLRSFDIDRIKIDRSFVTAIDPASGGSPVIQAIVDLARTSGLQVTAEGVETDEQLVFLSSIGCGSVQGYLLQKAVPAAEIERMFAGNYTYPLPRVLDGEDAPAGAIEDNE